VCAARISAIVLLWSHGYAVLEKLESMILIVWNFERPQETAVERASPLINRPASRSYWAGERFWLNGRESWDVNVVCFGVGPNQASC
jgi:hypothetical protein